MKTFEEAKNKVAKQHGYLNWEEFEVAQYPSDHEYSGRWILDEGHWQEAAELYARSMAAQAWDDGHKAGGTVQRVDNPYKL